MGLYSGSNLSTSRLVHSDPEKVICTRVWLKMMSRKLLSSSLRGQSSGQNIEDMAGFLKDYLAVRPLRRKEEVITVCCGANGPSVCVWTHCFTGSPHFKRAVIYGEVRSEISVKQQQTHGCVCACVSERGRDRERETERHWQWMSADAVNQTHTLESRLIPPHLPADCKSIPSTISKGYEGEPWWE